MFVVIMLLFFVYSGIEVSDCGRYVLLYISKGAESKNKFYYCDLEKLDGREITGTNNPSS